MKRLTAILLILLTALPCFAVDRVLMVVATPPTTSGVALKAPGTTSAAQFVIPRYRTGSSFPAGQIVGYGPGTLLVGTATTKDQTPAAIVVTEGFTEDLAAWQGGTSGAQTAAVLQPFLEDCTIAGYHSSNWTTAGVVSDNPYTYNTDLATYPDLYVGADLIGQGGMVRNVNLFYIPGTAMFVNRAGNGRLGAILPNDKTEWTVENVSIKRVYRGLWMRATDCSCHCISVESARDWGVRLSNACLADKIHTFGVGYAAEADGTGGAGIWLADDGGCICSDFYAETGPVGLLISTNNNKLNGFKSLGCTTASIKIAGTNNIVSGISNCATSGGTCIGCDITNQYNTVTDGTFTLTAGATAIKDENGTGTCLRNLTINAYNLNTCKGVVVTGTLNFARYDVHVVGGTGIDLSAGHIGTKNTINVTTGVSTVTPVSWPSGETWNTTPSADANLVYINGVRYYKQ